MDKCTILYIWDFEPKSGTNVQSWYVQKPNMLVVFKALEAS